eukprot:CAMPEP_0197464358 /NCGR_PEP_ID=MMETSP1175-20131217/63981_1 /TAXON_ID=1003142 /ORGANISM="Triceratium dubium, Strain CCMP147" /LENGTH=371 /DNA_ID=CAMNT_0043000337 /DNA_START=9 /DNA_END=1124 /DNA_ORIENTATION=+
MTSSMTSSPCRDTSAARERTRSRRHNRRGKAVSAVAWATVAFVTPAFGLTCVRQGCPQTHPQTRAVWKPTVARTGSGGKTSRRAPSRSQLRYRDGDDDESTSRRIEHSYAVSHVRLPAAPSKTLRRWFGSVVSPSDCSRTPLPSSSCKNGREQYVLDDYLEFVDKRYHRLHDENEAETPKVDGRAGINTAWNWLKAQTPGNELEEDRRSEDALCVLGLAELASAELLQKHHLPVPESVSHRVAFQVTSPVIDAQASSEESIENLCTVSVAHPSTDTRTTNGRIASLSAGVSVLHRMHVRMMAIASLRIRAAVFSSMRAMSQSSVAAIKSLSKAVPALVAMAGGAKTLKTAAVLATALMVFLRPLTRVALEA